jgi:hypothetical protein
MAYDPELAARVRGILAGRRGVTEKAMFGGLAFLLDGKMFCGILGVELLARVGPDAHDSALAKPHVRIMDFTGRPMRGYVFVGPAAFPTDAALQGWVKECEAHVRTLPDKPRKRSNRNTAEQAKPGREASRRKARVAARRS